MSRRALHEMVRLPSRRQATQILGAAFLLAVICFYFGVDAWHAILLGCAITVTGFALHVGSMASDARDLSWRPGNRSSRAGSRNEVANLSRSLRAGWGFVGLTAERRLNEIARRRLALEGLDLRNPEHQPAIELLIGGAAYRVLRSRQGRVPSLRALTYTLDMLDAIDSTHYPVPQPRARRWGPLPAIPFSLGRRP